MESHVTALTSAAQEPQTTATVRAANLSSTVGTCLALGIDLLPDLIEKDTPWVITGHDAARRGIVELPPFLEEETGWFFTPHNLRQEAEADRDIVEGKVARFADIEELIRDLRS